MSLINQALNRAKQAQETNPPPGGSEVQIRSAPSAPPANPSFKSTLAAVAYIVVVFVFLILGMVLLRGISHRNALKASARPIPTAPAATVSPAHSTPAETHASGKSAKKPGGAVTGVEPGSTNSPVVLGAPAPLKLQAIFFDPTRPSAIISGQSVTVGDRVRGSRVVKIDRSSVTLTGDNQTKVLKLE